MLTFFDRLARSYIIASCIPNTDSVVLNMFIDFVLLFGYYAILLCDRPNRLHYGSCPSVRLSVRLSVPYRFLTEK